VTGPVDGSLARKLDFGEKEITGGPQSRLRLAPASRALRGPDKYKVLAHRRHQAQIKARRLLELASDGECGSVTSDGFESMRGQR
jgi:hypothetical protein